MDSNYENAENSTPNPPPTPSLSGISGRGVLLMLALFISAFSCNKNVSSQDNSRSTDEFNQASSSSTFPPDLCAKNADFKESPFFLETIGINPNGFDRFPEDVKCFTENAAICEHFAGEEAYSEERQKEILQALNKYCARAQELSPVLKKKYEQNIAIGKILTVCDTGKPAACGSFKK